jgi:DNA adenine methylase
MEPLFKWVGSKRWITKRLKPLIKSHLSITGTYYEPFAGSAAMLFAVNPNKAVISDTLLPLIVTYDTIKKYPMEVWSELQGVARDANTEEEYRDRRNRFNKLLAKSEYGTEFASLFIYLNKTGFNGLWRQTKDGEFNVPFGQHKSIKLPTRSDFLFSSIILQRTNLLIVSMPNEVFNVIDQASSGDVIFSDPPYFETFTDYDGLRPCSSDFHQNLTIHLWKAHLRGVTVIAMNNHTDETERWYKSFCNVENDNKTSLVP